MKYMFASDIHGSAYYCRKMLDAFEKEGAERLVLLGDLLYHGPRNDLMVLEFPVMADYCILSIDGKTLYATHGHVYNQNNLPPLCEGDILIHGHTHVLKAEQMEGYILLNPGSVSIPKEGNPPTYAVLENGVFSIMDFEGNIVKSIVL